MSAINITDNYFTIVFTGRDAEAINALLTSIQVSPIRAKAFATEYRLGMGYGQIDALADIDTPHLINIDGATIITGDYASYLNSFLYGIQAGTPGARNLDDLAISPEYHLVLPILWATAHGYATV